MRSADCFVTRTDRTFGSDWTRVRTPVRRPGPARIAQIDSRHGTLAVGRTANLCVVDPAATWTVDPSVLASKARNTLYAGRTLSGVVRHTICNGLVTVSAGIATR